jgi:hypothetical protein
MTKTPMRTQQELTIGEKEEGGRRGVGEGGWGQKEESKDDGDGVVTSINIGDNRNVGSVLLRGTEPDQDVRGDGGGCAAIKVGGG